MVALLLVPSLLVVAPSASANQLTCTAAFDRISVTPTFVDRNATMTIRVHLRDLNEAPEVGSSKAIVTVRARYNDGSVALSDVELEGEVSQPFARSVAISASAPEGRGTIEAQVRPFGSDPSSTCLIPPTLQQELFVWSFWVEQKPDLVVDPTTGLQWVEHVDGDDLPLQGQHQLADDSNNDGRPDHFFTRYLNSSPGNTTCFEESNQVPGRFHVQVKVQNLGSADFAGLPDLTEGALPLRLRVTTGGVTLGTQTFNVGIGKDGGISGPLLLNGTIFRLLNRTGLQDVRVHIDPDNVYADLNRTNNLFISPADKDDPKAVYVRAPDLVGELKGVRLTSDGKVTGDFNVTNVGDALAGLVPQNHNEAGICHSRTGSDIPVRVYLDKLEEASRLKWYNITLEPNGISPDQSFDSDKKVGAGVHRILLVVDRTEDGLGIAHELSELNNTIIATVAAPDLGPPTLQNVTINATSGFRTGAKINLSGNVLDDADFTLVGNNVSLNITYPDGTAHTFFVPKETTPDAGFQNTPPTGDNDVLWWFNGAFDQVGEYTVRVQANDTVHSVFFPALNLDPLRFTLSDFNKSMEVIGLALCVEAIPNQTLLGTADCLEVAGSSNDPQPVNRNYNPDNMVLRVRFKVPAGATGLQHELNNTQRKTVAVFDPDGVFQGNFTPTAICYNNLTAPNGTYQTNCGNAVETCTTPLSVCWVGAYQVLLGNNYTTPSSDQGPAPLPGCQPLTTDRNLQLRAPAQWNLTIYVGDAACKFRAHTPESLSLPVRLRFGLWDTSPARVENSTLNPSTTLAATTPAVFRADAYDNLRINRTFVRVLKGGQEILLEDLRYAGNNNVNRTGPYSRSFPTGIYTPLDLAGEYQWLIGAQDANRTITWHSPTGNGTCVPDLGCIPTYRAFSLQDTRPPTVAQQGAFLVTSAGVDSAAKTAFQVGENLTLEADVTDDTRINVTTEVQQASNGVAVVPARPMLRVQGDRYRLDGNLTTGPGGDLPEGEYQFVVRARDSANRETSSTLARFRVASNLPPSFSQRTPGVDGFGAPNTTVGVDLSDTLQGVLANSVAVRFGINTPGVAATPVSNLVVTERERRADGVPLVLRASFQLPSSVAHGDTVTVAVTASDGSTPPEVAEELWSFKIDGVLPRSVVTCTVSHPAACGSEGPQSVRGDTEFNLTATDPDPQRKAESGVAALRFSVSPAGATGAVQTVQGNTTLFRMSQFAAQDGFYTLRFRAVDAAGNEEPERSHVFVLDSQGPGIENTLVTPTSAGWNLTATIADAASEVRSARVFVRGGATAFEERPMSRLPDTRFWYGTLPGARRGAQVCYYLEATDFLGNVATNGTSASPVCFQSENHPPSLTVVSPRDGDTIGASMTVRWSVSDLDGDPVTVSVAYRRSGEVTLVPVPLSTEEQGSRTKTLDTSGLIAGQYVLQVTASDNQAFNNRTVRTLNLTLGQGTGTDGGRPTLDRTTVAIGEPIKVRVELPGNPSDVTARLLRDGNLVASEPMEQVPAGSRFYEATFVVQEAGVYTVEVIGTDENGIPFRLTAASNLTVSGGFPLLDAVLMGVLAAAVVALGVVGLRRRGWV